MGLSKNGFTMIEILMVIVVISILSFVGLPKFLNFLINARLAAVDSTLAAFRTGIQNASVQANIFCDPSSTNLVAANHIFNNDITTDNDDLSGAAVVGSLSCSTAQITEAVRRRLVNGVGIYDGNGEFSAENPFNSQSGLGDDSLGCVGCDPDDPCACTPSAGIGWCFDHDTQHLWAASNENGEL